MKRPESTPYLLCMLAGLRRVIVLTAASSVDQALRYGTADWRSQGGSQTPRLWIEARDWPATNRMMPVRHATD